MKALKCKMLGAKLGYAYTLYGIYNAFCVDDHLPTMHIHVDCTVHAYKRLLH